MMDIPQLPQVTPFYCFTVFTFRKTLRGFFCCWWWWFFVCCCLFLVGGFFGGVGAWVERGRCGDKGGSLFNLDLLAKILVHSLFFVGYGRNQTTLGKLQSC